MMFYLYIIITAVIATIIFAEMFREKNWKHQLAMAIILVPLVLRVLQIK